MRLLASVLVAAGCAAPDAGPSCRFGPGDLVITEIMADPNGADDGLEWLEIVNAGPQPVDLAGLTLVASRADGSSARTHVMTTQPLAAGGFLALGDVPPDRKPLYLGYGFGADLELRNHDGRIALLCGATVVDEVSYALAPTGAALELDGALAPTAAANDVAGNWCPAVLSYDGVNRGTPGAANEPCAAKLGPGMCQDGDTLRPGPRPGRP
jgi:hypothetical protein